MKNTKPEEFKKIERLLERVNYEVSLNLYGPAEAGSLIEILRRFISIDCEISEAIVIQPKDAISDIIDKVLYCDESIYPQELKDFESNKAEVTTLLRHVFNNYINFEYAKRVAKFNFKNGHPFHPIMWDFAYDIYSNNQRWVIVGAASD